MKYLLNTCTITAMSVFVLISNVGNSQETNIAVILDNTEKRPIPFASVYYYLDSIKVGTNYADANGLVNSISKNFNKVKISSLGFKTTSFSVLNDSIFLEKDIIQLEAVKVVKIKKEFKTLGYSDYKKKYQFSMYSGNEICVYIENNYSESKLIKSLLFNMKNSRNSAQTAVRIHLYSLNKAENLPDQEILTQDLIYYINKKSKNIVEVDISALNVELPLNGLFVGIELLGNVDETTGSFVTDDANPNDTAIAINHLIDKSITFKRDKFSDNKWYDTSFLKQDVMEIAPENYPNASFGIVILE